MSNSFFMDDSKEVDDDAFLNHPRSGSSGYMLQNSRQASSTPGYNQFSSSDRQRNALGLDSEGNKEYGMDRVQVRIIKCKFIRKHLPQFFPVSKIVNFSSINFNHL